MFLQLQNLRLNHQANNVHTTAGGQRPVPPPPPPMQQRMPQQMTQEALVVALQQQQRNRQRLLLQNQAQSVVPASHQQHRQANIVSGARLHDLNFDMLQMAAAQQHRQSRHAQPMNGVGGGQWQGAIRDLSVSLAIGYLCPLLMICL